MASLQIPQSAIAAAADRIAQARQLHGKDSSYTIGLLAGVELLAGADSDTLKQIHGRLLELEEGPAADKPRATASQPAPERRRPPTPPADTPETAGADLAENTWIRGAVKWFNNDKGYGFISTDANTDVFVHWRDISSWDRSLAQGDPVEFMVTKTAKGFQAINVMKPDAKPDGAADGDAAATAETAAESTAPAALSESSSPDALQAEASADEPAGDAPDAEASEASDNQDTADTGQPAGTETTS